MTNNSSRGSNMDVNSEILNAAKKVVVDGLVTNVPVMIPGYAEMFVSSGEDDQIQSIDYFEDSGRRYAIGPMKK